MQTWMNQSEGDTIGIAFSGMGSEGNALGSGLNPFTSRQYAFQTMETLDALGLYGKDLNVIGHSMGGAAGMEMGLAIDALHPVDPPDVRYVLIAPAVGPDSVPFLTEGLTSGLIDLQNDFGSTWPLDPRRWLAHLGNVALGGTVVNALLPGAPDYIQGVHSGYAGNYGFEQLAATSKGLLVQGYPDPSRVASFLAQNRVLVVAAAQDRLVDPQVVERVFGDDVITVPGNHYPHLGNSVDPAAAGSPAVILEAAKQLLNAPFLPHFRPGGGGGGGRLNVR
jgi:pimeloyl-ACP methyl ester carboxylesterase